MFVAGLIIGMGPIQTAADAMSVFIAAIPYNVYPLSVHIGLIASAWMPDFGPMRDAEKRAQSEGKLIADGAEPLMAVELTEIQPESIIETSLFGISFSHRGRVCHRGRVDVRECKALKRLCSPCLCWEQSCASRVLLSEITATAMMGIKGIMPAVIILVFAYALNDLSAALNTARIWLQSRKIG